jgi:hypothetical protein
MECNECSNNKPDESGSMIEVWKWKEKAGNELLNMSQEERLEHYTNIIEQVEKEYGINFKKIAGLMYNG